KEPPYRQVTGVYYGHTLSMWTQHKTYKVSALPSDGPLPSPLPGLEILHQLPTELFEARGLLASGTGWISLDRFGAVAYESKPALFYLPGPAGTELNWLRSLSEKLGELADAVPFIVEMGGEAVPKLQVIAQSPTFAPFAIQLIRRIGVDTRKRLADRVDDLICPKCLARFTIHLIKMPRGRPIEVCGCRVCGQSREFDTWAGRIVAELDEGQAEPTRQTGDVLYRNWVALKRLFDFDAVEIRRACDEQIERFAQQVGNDPDARRRARYGQLTCRVTDPTLSANSRRVLESVFGQVVG
ncbi:MAG: hypothetical protein R3264_23145, partial [Anaerolineae bacterium]|nr:hypothetical protein [Anaerolineae bacterium]